MPNSVETSGSTQISGWSLIFLFDREERVLLMRRSLAKRLLPGVVNGIGGRIEPTDASLHLAAARELREETGLEADRFESVGTMLVQRSFQREPTTLSVIHILRCRHFSGVLADKCPEGELFWLPADEVPGQPTTRELQLYWPFVRDPRSHFHLFTAYHDDVPAEISISP